MESSKSIGMVTRGAVQIKVEPESSLRVNWSKQNVECLLTIIIQLVETGKIVTEKGFKQKDWNLILGGFNRKTGLSYEKGHLQNFYSDLKKKYSTFTAIKENSGFGFDEVINDNIFLNS
jgi:hypothetical protein